MICLNKEDCFNCPHFAPLRPGHNNGPAWQVSKRDFSIHIATVERGILQVFPRDLKPMEE